VLFLDNFEQVTEAAPAVSAVFGDVPSLTVVVTSRGALRLADEHELPLPPLARDPAVELFVRRAGAHNPRFAPARMSSIASPRSASALTACRWRSSSRPRGHGSSRPGRSSIGSASVSRFSPKAGATRPSGTAPCATIAWSHDLLDTDQQRLFEQLAVFHSGWSIETSEAVADGPVLDPLTALLDHSLVTRDGSRFTMLETVREYAAELLAASPDAPSVARRHAAWCVAFTQAAERALEGPEQALWFDRLDAEQENLRAAAAWGVANGEPERPATFRWLGSHSRARSSWRVSWAIAAKWRARSGTSA
jgi:predicted ATPase